MASLNGIANVLPLRPFNQALTQAFAPHASVNAGHLVVLLAWGAAGARCCHPPVPVGAPTRIALRGGRLVVPKMAGPAPGQSIPKPDEPGDGGVATPLSDEADRSGRTPAEFSASSLQAADYAQLT